ncbi:MAG: hypothetical protein MR949_08540 [Veillonellaceae bacterium]|nr:hypothetical protein [Veillonellaceae bacterium]
MILVINLNASVDKRYKMKDLIKVEVWFLKVVMLVGSRNTACGHNDFCSVRLNGPTWRFILTH